MNYQLFYRADTHLRAFLMPVPLFTGRLGRKIGYRIVYYGSVER